MPSSKTGERNFHIISFLFLLDLTPRASSMSVTDTQMAGSLPGLLVLPQRLRVVFAVAGHQWALCFQLLLL